MLWIINNLRLIPALPILVAAPIYTRIVGRVSAKPALVIGMSADVVCVWLFPLFPYDWAWIVLQIVSGATLGHFSLITEAWLNLFSTERSRVVQDWFRPIHGAPTCSNGVSVPRPTERFVPSNEPMPV